MKENEGAKWKVSSPGERKAPEKGMESRPGNRPHFPLLYPQTYHHSPHLLLTLLAPLQGLHREPLEEIITQKRGLAF